MFEFLKRNKPLLDSTTREPGHQISESVQDRTKLEMIEAFKYLSPTYSFTYSYDGEKTPGELGPLVDWRLDYKSLRARSWDSYLTSEITQTIVKRYVTWIIGKGLRLQAEPAEKILNSEGITTNFKEFAELTESRFQMFSDSKRTDYVGRDNLNKKSKEALINAIVGGDCLVIQRVEKGRLTIQLIDGQHITNPGLGSFYREVKNRGNKIEDGIELDKKGQHVAYYVKKRKTGEFDRVPVKGSRSKMQMAFLLTGFKYRINDNRGIPLISAILEKLKKLDRYTEATVGSAEERAKIVYYIMHHAGSTGENPMLKNMAKSFNAANENAIPQDINGKALEDKVAATTGKQAINMPVESELKSLDSKAEVQYSDFYTPNTQILCATFEMPPEVVFMKYENNYSSSRAAIKDWEHTIKVKRSEFGDEFLQPIYNNWLTLEVMKNKIQAPGYVTAYLGQNFDVLESYQRARFVGSSVPHIDPMKEVKAIREKLGPLGKDLPLTTLEKATEQLDEGDSENNLLKMQIELDNFREKFPPAEPEDQGSGESVEET